MQPDQTVKERPILFQGDLVKAILRGTKTVTRRPVKPLKSAPLPTTWNDDLDGPLRYNGHSLVAKGKFGVSVNPLPPCPYGAPGDKLWVRETMKQVDAGKRTERWTYAADGTDVRLLRSDPSYLAMVSWAHHKQGSTCVSIHMPRWASRLLLEVVDVRVDRLQSITADDVRREGVEPEYRHGAMAHSVDYIGPFRAKWDAIYGRDKSLQWAASPWVWRVAFKRVEASR